MPRLILKDRGDKGASAGPATAAPSEIANWLPWQGQLIRRPTTDDTVQPAWVQVAEKTRKRPLRGWVTTTLRRVTTTPPPTGTLATAMTAAPAADAASSMTRGPATPTDAAQTRLRRDTLLIRSGYGAVSPPGRSSR